MMGEKTYTHEQVLALAEAAAVVLADLEYGEVSFPTGEDLDKALEPFRGRAMPEGSK